MDDNFIRDCDPSLREESSESVPKWYFFDETSASVIKYCPNVKKKRLYFYVVRVKVLTQLFFYIIHARPNSFSIIPREGGTIKSKLNYTPKIVFCYFLSKLYNYWIMKPVPINHFTIFLFCINIYSTFYFEIGTCILNFSLFTFHFLFDHFYKI